MPISVNGPRRPTHHHVPPVLATFLASLIPAAVVLFSMRWPLGGLSLMLPVSVAAFSFAWLRLMAPRLGGWAAGASGLALGLVGGHLALWMPLLLVSYGGGLGLSNAGYAVFGALVTSGAVAWYVLTAHLWQSLALLAVMAVAAMMLRQISRKDRA